MVSVDISLTPSLPGATLSLSLSPNKRILGDFMGLCFFGRLRLRQKEGVTRILRASANQNVAGGILLVLQEKNHGKKPKTQKRKVK